MKRGCAWAWFHAIWTCYAKVLYNIEWFFPIAEDFGGIGMCLLVFLESS
jgi:hypothetical protein